VYFNKLNACTRLRSVFLLRIHERKRKHWKAGLMGSYGLDVACYRLVRGWFDEGKKNECRVMSKGCRTVTN
jgi:hypothetical protein